jgi:hypothetical protein
MKDYHPSCACLIALTSIREYIVAMRPDDGETAALLLAFIEQHNLSLTADQLRRLHLERLIARPLQDHPEGKVGSETVYPKGTSDLLLAICVLHQQKRPFAAIAWQLWRDGHPIPLARIRADLRKTAKVWERLRRALTRPGSRTFSKLAWKGLMKVASHRFRDSFINQARKRVGTTSFDTFTRILLEIAAGNFQGYADDDTDSHDEEQKIVEKGFGLSRTVIDRALGVDWTENLERTLVELTDIVASNPWESWLDQASDSELLRNRDELCLLLTALESLSSAIEDVAGKRASGGLILYQMLCRAARKNFPIIFLMWSVARQRLQTTKDELLLAAQQWLKEGLPAYTALRQLQVEVPVTRSILASHQRRAIMGSKQAQMRYFADCQAFYEHHREELMAFWQRHPEWYKPDAEKQAEAPAC